MQGKRDPMPQLRLLRLAAPIKRELPGNPVAGGNPGVPEWPRG